MNALQKPPGPPSPPPSLTGFRILVVQIRPQAALGIGAAVARAGADVNVCRSPHAALDVLGSRPGAFHAAALDGELDRKNLLHIAGLLRSCQHPCLAVGVGSDSDVASVRRLVEAGVMELVVPPLSAQGIVEALGRCATATTKLRARLEGAPPASPGTSGGEGRRPCHWSAAAPGVVPRHNPDIEHAVARCAKLASLSPREVSVLKFIALGYRYQEIGEALSISGRTVKMHAANVRRKVGASDRFALVRKVLAV